MYSKEQKDIALRIYHQTESVTETIRILGYPTRRNLYTWIAEENTPPKTRKEYPVINNPPDHPRNPPLEVKLDAIHRCYELGENIKYVSEDIGYSRASIYQWRKRYLKEGTLGLMNHKNITPGTLVEGSVSSTDISSDEINQLKAQMQDMQLEIDKFAVSNAVFHLADAYDRFFKKQNHFPKFKSKRKSKKSYTTNFTNNNILIGKNVIKLPKVGMVKAVIHKLPKDDWKLKSVTVSQDSVGNYFASVLFEYEQEDIPSVSKSSTNAIGLDYKSDGLYMDSNGNKAGVHKYYRESHKKLAKQQRRLSRKAGSKKNETKSSNYFKQMRKVNRIYRKIANQRLDSLHKKSTEIANQYDIVCVEDLDMKAIGNKGFGNGKATFDNSYGIFLNMLEYKLKERGKYFVKVDKWYPSSQICHCCGSVKKLDLKDRVYTCDCGYTGDRDHNAAINILTEGLRILQSL